MRRVKRVMAGTMLLGALALTGVACDASADGTSPGQQLPADDGISDPAGGVDDGGGADLGGGTGDDTGAETGSDTGGAGMGG